MPKSNYGSRLTPYRALNAAISSVSAVLPNGSRQNRELLSGSEGLHRVVVQRVDEVAGHDAEVCAGRQPTRCELTLQVFDLIFLAGDRIGHVLRGAGALTILVRLHGQYDVLNAERYARWR